MLGPQQVTLEQSIHVQYYGQTASTQPLGTLSDHFQGTALVLYFFEKITEVFRETIYYQDQTMYNYIVPKLQKFK